MFGTSKLQGSTSLRISYYGETNNKCSFRSQLTLTKWIEGEWIRIESSVIRVSDHLQYPFDPNSSFTCAKCYTLWKYVAIRCREKLNGEDRTKVSQTKERVLGGVEISETSSLYTQEMVKAFRQNYLLWVSSISFSLSPELGWKWKGEGTSTTHLILD